jgi:hypothetical protein
MLGDIHTHFIWLRLSLALLRARLNTYLLSEA